MSLSPSFWLKALISQSGGVCVRLASMYVQISGSSRGIRALVTSEIVRHWFA